ncbi:MAG: hypothetical protein ACI4CS_00095 [Candidatus Weimeria sp.]
MFTLKENNILKDFSCKYEDSYHNRLRLARKGNGFYAKLKFGNSAVSMPVIRVSFPLKDDETGINVNINFSDGHNHSGDEDVKEALSGTEELVNRWICMMLDIQAFELGLKTCGEDAKKDLIKSLKKYEELAPVIRAVS